MRLNPSSQDDKAPENAPLDESEINRLIAAARAESYRPAQTAPNAKVEVFRPKSLLELARMRRDAEAAATVSDPTGGDDTSQAKDADMQARGQDDAAAGQPSGEPAPEADANTRRDASLPQAETSAAAPQVSQMPQDAGPYGQAMMPPPRDEPKDAPAPDVGQAVTQDPLSAGSTSGHAAGSAHDPLDPQAREQIHAEGFAAGRAAAAAEMETRMASAVEALEKAAHALRHPPTSAVATLRADIAEAVLKLAAERAGLEIDTMPTAFVERIELLAERIHGQATQAVLRLNPDDHAAIAEVIEGSDTLAVMRIVTSAELSRGDVELIVDGLRMSDRLLGQPTRRKRANAAQQKTEGKT